MWNKKGFVTLQEENIGWYLISRISRVLKYAGYHEIMKIMLIHWNSNTQDLVITNPLPLRAMRPVVKSPIKY